MSDIICIYTTFNSAEANLIKVDLENAGIPCYLRTDNAGGTLPHLALIGGIGIMINEEDKEQVIKMIRKRMTPTNELDV